MADTTAAPDRTADGQPTLKRVMGPGLLLLSCGPAAGSPGSTRRP